MMPADPENWLITVLAADDDEDDRMLIEDAIRASGISVRLRFVTDGQHLTEYLQGDGFGTESAAAPRPSIVLLDLNMPRKSGFEALREIKTDPRLRQIPVIVLTTSSERSDITRAYDLGANSFITKPTTHETLMDAMRTAISYWTSVERPDREDH